MRIQLGTVRVIQDAFKRRYVVYWNWIRREMVHAHCGGKIETVCGWKLNVNDRTKDGTLQNFHPRTTCVDIMRRAVALMADRGIAICEIVHDAVMVPNLTDESTGMGIPEQLDLMTNALTSAEVAVLIHIDAAILYRHAKTGKFPAFICGDLRANPQILALEGSPAFPQVAPWER